MSAPRFKLGSGSGLRVVRWIGRGLTAAALWPFWYAFYGGVGFDWDAMMVGGPAVALGLAVWRWAGHRLRHPPHHLEIDRAADAARLRRGDAEPVASCTLAALGPWSYRTWQTTTRSKHGVSHHTHWAARAAGPARRQDDRDGAVGWGGIDRVASSAF